MSGSNNIECKNVEEKILDYLYEELDAGEQEAMRVHVEGCARCKAELESFGRVRSAAKSVMLAEPPQAASAKLLYQAAQLAPRGKVLSFPARVAKVVRHPAFAMAAAFLVVGGFAGWQMFNHKMMLPPTAENAAPVATPTPVTETTPVAPPPVQVVPQPPVAAADPAGTVPMEKDFQQSPAGKVSGHLSVTSAPLGTKVMVDGVADKTINLKKPGYDQAAATLTLEANKTAASPSTTNMEMRNAPADARLKLDPIARDDNEQKPMHHAAAKAPAPAKEPPSPPPPAPKPDIAKREESGALRASGNAKDELDRTLGDHSGLSNGAGGAGAGPRRSEVALADGENEELSKAVAKGKKGASIPSLAPPPVSSIGRGNAFDDDGVQEGTEILRQKNAADRKSSLSGRFGYSTSSQGRAVAKPLPTPAAPAAQSQAVAVSRSPQPDEEQQLVARLSNRAEGDCTGESGLYRDMVEHFPDDITPDLRFKHAKCELRAGRYSEAKKLLQLLRQQSPSLAKKIDHELKTIEMNEQDEKQRQVERAVMPKPAEKKAKRAAPAAMDSVAPADAYSPSAH